MPSVKRANQTASLQFEHEYWERGCRAIVGIDEAGRGTWAGPVSAGAVCLPIDHDDLHHVLQGVRDSKQMTPRQRSGLVDKIKSVAVGWGVGQASAEEIDTYGILPATQMAMKRALEHMHMKHVQPDCLLLDSIKWPQMCNVEKKSIIKGDTLSLSIAAASILAKVWRDEHMHELEEAYPGYGFAAHKGYGTAKHRAALDMLGASPIHRMSFAPMKNLRAGV